MKLSYSQQLVDNYMEDEVVYYSVVGKRRQRRHTKRVFRKLEKDTGIDFQKISCKHKNITEIEIEFVDQITGDTDNQYAGMCWNNPYEGKAKIEVDSDSWHWKTTTVHEIGHALGLDHDHHNTDSVMSYNRNYYVVDYFSDDNLQHITELFG